MNRSPRSLKKKNARKRVPVFGIGRHWHNPFQKLAVGVVVLSFIGFSVVDRARQRRCYDGQLDRAKELCTQMEALDTQVAVAYTNLRKHCEGLVFKGRSEREDTLERRLEELNQELHALFDGFNECLAAMPFRYRSMEGVREWFAGCTRRRIESALARRDHGWARLCYNASHVKDLLSGIKPRVEGKGSFEITGPDSVQDVIAWPMLDDGETPRLIQGDAAGRGKPPFRIDVVEKGSYVLQVTCGNGKLMPFPVYINHGEAKRVDLVVPESVPDGMAFVAGGDFIFGGEDSRFYREHKCSLPAFFIKKHEVTVAEYLEFWQGLADPGLKSEYMGRIRFQQQDRRYVDAWDEQGNLTDERLRLEYPVVGISHEAAEAFCKWKSHQAGVAIRLPTAWEWEKAARGVDGRRYVWGNAFVKGANLALTKDNEKGKTRFPLWAPPGKFMRDVSVYGVYDMAGNVREMTSTSLPGSETFYQLKGGSAATPEDFLPCSYASDTPVVPSDVGFRYVQEFSVK